MPYISTSSLKSYRSMKEDFSDLKQDYSALKKSSINLNSYNSVKKSLANAKAQYNVVGMKLKSIQNSYTGMKGRYSAVIKSHSMQKARLESTLKAIAQSEQNYKAMQSKYNHVVKSQSTSIATMQQMKIKHGEVVKQLMTSLNAAKAEAESAMKEAQMLTLKIAEIEKNERSAREGSLTQALVNTRDFVFDNTIAGVPVSENTSRGLSMLAGAAVTAFLITRVS